jgi:hypothetical protein
MVIIYTSSRRAVLRRFAALLIAPQRFVCYFAMCRYATPHRSLHRSSVRRNDLFVTTLRTPRLGSARLRVSRCAAIQRYDLLCTSQRTPLLTAPPCIVLPRSTGRRSATRLNSTICLLQRVAPQRSSALCIAPHRAAAQLNDLFVTSCRRAPLRYATLRNSAQRFVCYNATNGTALLASPPRITPLFTAPIRNSTQRFVCYNATQRSPMQLVWPRRAAAHCLSPQLNDLFVTTQLNELRLDVPPRVAPHRSAPQLNSTICLLLRSATLFSNTHRSSSCLDTTLCNELKL